MSENRFKLTSALMMSTVLAIMGPSAAHAQDTQQPEDNAETQADIQTQAPADEIIVRGSYIPDEKRITSEIASTLDAEDFAITGDADIADAMSRITGISVANDKFAVVRGLNDRYSNTILNGSPVSSPEPLRRAVPLDLFPTAIIGDVLVQKTYSPQYSADFGGGVIALETITLPDERFFEIEVSGGVNSATTLHNGLLYNGGGESDYTGWDDGTRNIPDSFEGVFADNRVPELDDATNTAIVSEFASDWTDHILQQGDIAGDAGLSVEMGDRYDVSDTLSLGVTAAAGYDSEWRTREGVRRITNIGGDGALQIQDDYDRFSTQHEITSNALLSIGADIADNHTITGTAFGARSTIKEARSLTGFRSSEFRIQRVDNTEWFERQTWIGQLTGEHIFPALMDLEVDWRASYSEAYRDSPDNRQLVYQLPVQFTDPDNIPDDVPFTYLGEPDGNAISFSKIEDDSSDLGVDAMLPLMVAGRDVELLGGYSYYEKNRDTVSRFFRFDGTVPAALRSRRADAIYTPEAIEAGLYDLDEAGGGGFPALFRGLLEVDSVYGGLDAQVTNFLRIAAGVRYEESTQVASTYDIGEETFEPGSEVSQFDQAIESEYALPAFTATWNVLENVQLRFAYSQTIARPQFRETAFSQFQDIETDTTFRGNPFLTNTEFENFDARAEYYFARGEFITFGAFYKDVTNPIEEFNLSLGDEFGSSFLNAPSAELYGFEVEFEKALPITGLVQDRMGLDWAWLEPKSWFFKTNYTYTKSEVSADGTVTIANLGAGGVPQATVQPAEFYVEDGRQLQGQSENLFNIQLGYEDDEARSRGTLALNFTGERIRQTRNLSAGLPAIIEEPPVSLDFIYSRDFTVYGGEYSVGFKAQNILDEDYRAFQEGTDNTIDIDRYDLGRTFSVSLSRRF